MTCGTAGCDCGFRLVADISNCPNNANHEPSPSGYVDCIDWAKHMGKTHRQTRCEGCGLYAIWEPKKKRAKP